MAKRRRKAPAKRRAVVRRRRRSTAKRRSPVTRLRRGAVYLTNRKRRRRSYRRNPGFSIRGIGGQIIDTAKGAAAVLVGRGAGKMIAGFIPINGGPLVEAGKGFVSAILIRMIGGRFISPELARIAAYSAAADPLGAAIVAQVPAAGKFFGMGAYGPMYMPSVGGMSSYAGQDDGAGDDNMGAYSGEVWN